MGADKLESDPCHGRGLRHGKAEQDAGFLNVRKREQKPAAFGVYGGHAIHMFEILAQGVGQPRGYAYGFFYGGMDGLA